MSEKSVQWGYILVAPGRPSYDEQIGFLADLGITADRYGPVWLDEIRKGSTRPKTQLVERNDLMLAAWSGDAVHVFNPICLGLSAADITWFAAELIGKGVRLYVGGEEVATDEQVSMAAGVASRAISAHHVAESRRAGGKRRKAKAPPPPKYEKRPCVYRHFDASGELLYIGACTSYAHREQQHRSRSAWWPKIARVTFEYHETLREAFEAERAAIWFEKPPHNLMVVEPDSEAFVAKAAEMAEAHDPELAARIRAMKAKS